jgi:nucleotide-binding universal stress UspA family protein
MSYQRILVPVDGSPTSTKALTAALQLAREGGGRVRLVHSLDELAYVSGFEYSGNLIQIARESAEKVLADAGEMAKAAGVLFDTQLIDFPGQRLGETIAQQVKDFDADLVVVGTHGRRGFSRALLGSGAEQIIRMSPTPVLVIRGDAE